MPIIQFIQRFVQNAETQTLQGIEAAATTQALYETSIYETSIEYAIAHFRHEFVKGSGIDPELYAVAVEVWDNEEITHGHDVSYPIHEVLGLTRSRFWQHKTPHDFVAAAILLQETGEVFQVKAINPIRSRSKGSDGRWKWKPIKYQSPCGAGSRACLPPIAPETFKKICDRLGLDHEEARAEKESLGGFWAWVKAHPEYPIVITEGDKKALCLLSNGYIAIALTGCWGAIQAKDSNKERLEQARLIADLQPFAVPGRKITIALDIDLKPKTRRDVWEATKRTARLLEKAGCTVAIAQWDNAGGKCKGVDDLIVNCGINAWEKALATARSPKELAIVWRLQNPLGKYEPNLVVNVADLSEAINVRSLPSTGTIALLSGMGTGKTLLIREILRSALDRYPHAIAPGHREALQKGFAARLGLDYLQDCDRVDGKVLAGDRFTKRLSLCWDSILAINPKEYPRGSYVLVLDEIDAGLLHLILGGTCGREGKRPALIARAIELIKNAGLVVCASADITGKELDFVAAIRNEQPFIVQNEFQAQRWEVDFVGSQQGLAGSTRAAKSLTIARLASAIQKGRRVFLATDSQVTAERVENLALLLGVDPSEILRYDGHTSSAPLQQEFAENPDQFLAAHKIRLLIASPALTSGVSIEGDRFDLVFGIFEGKSIAPWDCTQQLGRVRAPVKRIIYAAWRGRMSDLTDKFNALEAKGDLHRRSELIGKAIEDPSLLDSIDFDSPDAAYAAQSLAFKNQAMADFGLQIRLRLEAAGHKVEAIDIAPWAAALKGKPDEVMAQLLALASQPKVEALLEAIDLWKAAGDRVKAAYLNGVTNADQIEAAEAKKLRDARVLQYGDRLKLERYEIADFYAIDPDKLTTEDVAGDRKGAKRRAIIRLESLLWDGLSMGRDREKLDRLTQWNEPITPQDLPTDQLKVWAADLLGIPDVLARAIEKPNWNSETDWVIDFANKCQAEKADIKRCLGFTITPEMPATQVLGMVLAAYEFKTTSRRSGTGDRERVYSIAPESLEAVKALLAARAEKHTSKGLQPRPHPLTRLLLEGVAVGEGTPRLRIAPAPQDPPISTQSHPQHLAIA